MRTLPWEGKNYSCIVVFCPKISLLYLELLKKEKFYKKIKILDLQLGLIPLSNDILSLEIKNCYRQLHLDDNRTSIT